MPSPLSQALSHPRIPHLPLVSVCLTRRWACVYIVTPMTTSELLVLSLLEGQGFPIPPPAAMNSARGPLSRLSPLLPLPHLSFAPTIPKLHRSLAYHNEPGLCLTVMSQPDLCVLSSLSCPSQTRVAYHPCPQWPTHLPVAGLVALGVYPSPREPGRRRG